MRIVILTIGTRGDVEPYAALGAGFLRAGHHVVLAAPLDFEREVRQIGLPFHPLMGKLHALTQPGWQAGGLNPVRLLQSLSAALNAAFPVVQEAMSEAYRLCQRADVVIAGGLMFYAGPVLAELLPARVYLTAVGPVTPTAAFQNPWFPTAPAWLPHAAYNRCTHWLAQQLTWRVGRPILKRVWRTISADAEVPFWFPMSRYSVLYGYSPTVLPVPDDWPENQIVTGYWFSEPQESYQPAPDLETFLQTGSRPVYIGFGSVQMNEPRRIAACVRDALEECNQRAVLSIGWAGMSGEMLNERIHVVEDIPHNWLFPRMAAVVHHGGAGTTAAALRAGVPAVVIPHSGDQPFWGERVCALGAGLMPMSFPAFSSERLAEAIQEATSNDRVQTTAAALGARIRAEDGVMEAVAQVERDAS